MRFKIDWASLTVGRKFTVFALFYFAFEGNFQVQAPRRGGLYLEGDLTEGFCVTSLGGLYLEGLIFGILRYVFIQVLIFAEKKADVDDIHEYLLLKGVEAVAIHGDKGISSVFTRSVNIP